MKVNEISMNKIENSKKLNFNLSLDATKASLRNKVKLYIKRAQKVEQYLCKKPEEWGKFQNEFNLEMNNIFRDIMNFEKFNLANDNEKKVYKLKKLFRNKIRKFFVRGEYSKWTLDKPFGYSGDFKIIDNIYQNIPRTTGYDRLFDNYYQMTAICVAVRNRKNDFVRIIINFINEKKNLPIKIMNLGSGPCREIKEILSSSTLKNKNIIFDCYDKEKKAIEFAKNLLKEFKNINLIKKNILRFIVAKNINSIIKEKYDFIYATGFFDYLDNEIGIRLIRNLKKILKVNGVLLISNARDKYSNPTFHYMDWAGEWELVYRTDDEFIKIFIEAGFKQNELKVQYEQQGIMQYIIATNLAR